MAAVHENCVEDRPSAAVVQEMRPRRDTAERRRPEVAPARGSLFEAVRQLRADKLSGFYGIPVGGK